MKVCLNNEKFRKLMKQTEIDRKEQCYSLKYNYLAHFFDKARSWLYSLIYIMLILQAKVLSAGWIGKKQDFSRWDHMAQFYKRSFEEALILANDELINQLNNTSRHFIV